MEPAPEKGGRGQHERLTGTLGTSRLQTTGTWDVFKQVGALKEGQTIVFVDQSGFYLLPAVVRTYAPIGQTPVLGEELSRDHLSAMSAITLEGKLLMVEQDRAFKGPDVVRFLKHALGQIPGKLLIIWDGSPIHRAEVVKGFLADGAAARVQLEQLPGYAPELNPDEGILEASEVCGAQERLLLESLGTAGRATQSQGALEAQKARYPRLHQAAGLRGLGICAEISNVAGRPGPQRA